MNMATLDAYQDGKMNTNFAKSPNVIMIVNMGTVLVPIHAHAKLDGVVQIVRLVSAYLDVKMGFAIYLLNVNATLATQECFVTNQCVSQDVYMVTAMHPENVFVTLDGLEKIAQNAYLSLDVTGKMDFAKSQWNVNARMGIMETFVNMPIAPPDVTHSMATASILILVGVTQAGQVQLVMNV